MATATYRPKIRSAFGDMLRAELEAKGVSLKELARRMAGIDATEAQINGQRRLLQKYLTGEVRPSTHARVAIAAYLLLPDDHFAEEAERLSELQEIADALMPLVDVLHRLVIKAKKSAGK